MRNGSLHVQHKDQDLFDRENRVIGPNVVAVSSDTGLVCFGDGSTRWRELPKFGGGGDKADPEVDGYDGTGYSGPLHVVVFTQDEAEDEEMLEFVPAANEMAVFGNVGVFFGDGVKSLAYLNPIAPPANSAE